MSINNVAGTSSERGQGKLNFEQSQKRLCLVVDHDLSRRIDGLIDQNIKVRCGKGTVHGL